MLLSVGYGGTNRYICLHAAIRAAQAHVPLFHPLCKRQLSSSKEHFGDLHECEAGQKNWLASTLSVCVTGGVPAGDTREKQFSPCVAYISGRANRHCDPLQKSIKIHIAEVDIFAFVETCRFLLQASSPTGKRTLGSGHLSGTCFTGHHKQRTLFQSHKCAF
jgi:hypothetical protein